MNINKTSSYILIEILVAVLGGMLGTWLFVKVYPLIADYWATRSTASRQKKILSLEKYLAQYEADFADSRLFTARLVQIATVTIVGFGTTALCLGLAFVASMGEILYCEAEKQSDCMELTRVIAHWNWWDLGLPIDFSLLGVTAGIIFYSSAHFLRLQGSPEKYRTYILSRLSRLHQT